MKTWDPSAVANSEEAELAQTETVLSPVRGSFTRAAPLLASTHGRPGKGLPTNKDFARAQKPFLLIVGLGVYAIFGSAVTLVGWFGHLPRLTDWFGTGISMFPNTAVAGALAGLSVLLSLRGGPGARLGSRVVGLGVALIGGATLLEHLLNINLGIDRILIDPRWGQRAATTVGRMGPPASTSFLLLGVVFWLLGSRSAARRLVPVLAILVLGIASLGIVGYLFHADLLFAQARLTGTALQTATIISALAVAVMASAPDLEPIRTLLQNTAAGGLVRRALPFTVLLPVSLCGLFILARNALWFDRGMGVALLAMALSALLCGLLWWCARAVARHESLSNVTQARLQSLLSLMPAAVYACDADGRITFYNPKAAELWGREPRLNHDQERFCAVYKCWLGETLVRPEHTPMAAAVQEGKSFRGVEAVVERPDGTRIPVMVNIDPIFDAHGKPAGAINVFQDITLLKRAEAERKQAEQVLRLSEERFRMATFSEAITLYEQDSELRYTWLYPQHPEHAQALGKTDIEILGEQEGGVLAQLKREVLKSGESQRREAKTTLPGGVRFYQLLISARRNEQGNIIGVAGAALDITERKQAEEALRESEQRLRATFNQAGSGIAVADAAGLILEANEKFQDLTGYCIAELREAAIQQLTHREDLPQTRQNLERLLRGDVSHYVQEKRLVRKDGGHLWILATVAGLRDATGRADRFICVVQDITERRRTEECLRLQRQQLEVELADSKLLQEISAALVEEDNRDGLYQKLLDAAVAIMRSDMASLQTVDEKEDALRLLAWRGFSPDFGEVFSLNRRDTRTACSLARETGRRVIMADVEKCEYVNASAAILEAHRKSGIRAVQSTPLLSRGGNLVGVLSTHWRRPHEPTERDLRLLDILARQAADLLERRQVYQRLSTLAAVVENSDDAIITKNLDGIITSWNKGAERVFGYSAPEIIGKPGSVLIPAERQNEEPAILARLRAGEHVEHYETVRRRKDGELIDLSLTVSPIRDAEGKVIGSSKIARDVTELRKARESLARSHQELEIAVTERTASLREVIAQMEEFSYSVSHDLRAPVRAMQGYAKAMLEDYGGSLDAQGREYLGRIIRSGERMDRLVRDLLTYSRLARSDVSVQPVVLEVLVRDIISQYPEMQAPRSRIIVDGDLQCVLAHEPSLTQAISNLLSNAVKFVAPGVTPEVRVYSENRGDLLRLWFHDNGIGVQPEFQHRLFGLFERIHPKDNYEGTGIGLAVVRKSLERMGGRVGMESNGQGSKFWIELPACIGRKL